MARQFTTFSVVDILGQGGPTTEDAEEENSSVLQKQASCGTGSEGEGTSNGLSSDNSSNDVTVKYRQGTIRQMLPPAPAVSYSPDAEQDHPFLYPPSDIPSKDEEAAAAPTTEKRPPSKKRSRKGKRGTKRCRVSSEADSLYQPLSTLEEEAAAEEDDVFRSNISRQTRGAARAARDLSSAGETPSPPGNKSTGTKSTDNTSNPAEEPASTASKTSSASSDQQEYLEEEDEDKPKKKRARTAYTREQLQTMERHFRKSAYPDSQLLRVISSEARIPVTKIQVWFQNRRAKARKWGQVLPEPSSNSALYRGVLPSADSSRYLPPLQPSSSSSPTPRPAPTGETQPTSLPNSHPPSSSTALLPSLLTSYRCLYPPPPYPLPSTYPLLPPPPLPYPLSYSLYTGLQTSTQAVSTNSFNFQSPTSQPVITGDTNKQHL